MTFSLSSQLNYLSHQKFTEAGYKQITSLCISWFIFSESLHPTVQRQLICTFTSVLWPTKSSTMTNRKLRYYQRQKMLQIKNNHLMSTKLRKARYRPDKFRAISFQMLGLTILFCNFDSFFLSNRAGIFWISLIWSSQKCDR